MDAHVILKLAVGHTAGRCQRPQARWKLLHNRVVHIFLILGNMGSAGYPHKLGMEDGGSRFCRSLPREGFGSVFSFW